MMMSRCIFAFCAMFLFTTQWGCSLGQPDPLLFDDGGHVRTSVSMYEVDEAGIPSDCSALEPIEDADELVYVPISDGGEGEPVLIGVDAQAFCIGVSEDGELPEVDVDEDAGIDEDSALSITGRSNDVSVIDGRPSGQVSGRPPTFLHDPTPEPAND